MTSKQQAWMRVRAAELRLAGARSCTGTWEAVQLEAREALRVYLEASLADGELDLSGWRRG
jgi:hypothetical protein